MGSHYLHRNMSGTFKMIICVMFTLLILAGAGPQIFESTTQNAEDRRSCDYDPDNCWSWQKCCFDGRCVDDGVSCYETNCDLYDICRDDEICCNGECVDWSNDCLGALWGIGIAAVVASIVVPVLCCCCCGGCAIYWIMRRSRERRGRVHQPGVHMMQPQGQVYQPGMQMMPGGQVQQPGMQFISPSHTSGYPTQPGMVQSQDQGWMNPNVPTQDNIN